MSIKLQADEDALRTEILERMDKVSKAFVSGRGGDDIRNAIREAGERSHKLHMLLKDRGVEPKHHAYMIKNREMQPDAPEFYMHFHPIEDLLKFLENEHANDDPVDQTIGSVFSFSVFSRCRGRNDTYKVVRTKDGWEINHLSIAGPCNKGGNPFLFENLRQDFIQYPKELDGWMEWLWNQAKTEGLTEEQVQVALQQLANWISETERNAPSGGAWKGYA